MTRKLSKPMQLLQITWEGTNEVTEHSWERLSTSMGRALALAIESGMRFDTDDFSYIDENFHPGYWVGTGEGYYAKAIIFGNRSACLAFESWKKRPPFITDNVTIPAWRTPRKNFVRGRLAIGVEFYFNGEKAIVTSFAPDGSHLVACSYKDKAEKFDRTKILHRYKITVKQLRDFRKDVKKLADNEKMSIADMSGLLQRAGLTIQEAWKKVEERDEKNKN